MAIRKVFDSMQGNIIDDVTPGIIVLWSGSQASIPSGWALCDGTNGTPNLANRFIRSAQGAIVENTTGGTSAHTHGVGTLVNSINNLPLGGAIVVGAVFAGDGHIHTITGITGSTSTLPIWYALCYIMKL